MTYLRFGIRDLLWAMALIGTGLGWWLEHRSDREQRLINQANEWSRQIVPTVPGSQSLTAVRGTIRYADGTSVEWERQPNR